MSLTQKLYFLIFGILLLCPNLSIAQPNVDSLLNIANSTNVDSIKYCQYHILLDHFKFYDLEKTKEFADSIAEIYNRTNNLNYKETSDFFYGFYYRKKDQDDKAMEFFELSKSHALENGHFSRYCANMNEIGGIYFYQGKLAEALQINIAAAEFNQNATDIHANSRLSDNYNMIGLIYAEMKDDQKALDSYRKSISVSTTHLEESVPIGNMAEIFIEQNEVDSVNAYAERCYELEKIINSTGGIAYAEWLRSKAYFMARKYALAELSAEESIRLHKIWSEKLMMTDSYYLLSEAQLELKKFKSSMSNAIEGLALAEEIKNMEQISNGQKLISKINESLGRYDVALEYNKLYQTSLDTLQNRANSEKLNDLSVKYETAQKNEKIAEQKMALARKDVQKNNLIGGLLFLGLIPVFLFFRFRSSQKIANQEIQLLKKEQKLLSIDYIIQGQEEERKRIAQDLHDGLGGILSSAKLQMKNIQTEIQKLESLNLVTKAEVLIDDAYKEVRRISHDMMPGALVSLGLFAAIDDLAEQVSRKESLKVNTQWYTSDDEIQEKHQSIIYRIVQEAITNTVKYAQAENMLIQMSSTKDSFNLTIEDDGIGFDLNANNLEGLGIKGIKSRVDYLNGEVEIITKANSGTCYEISFPIVV